MPNFPYLGIMLALISIRGATMEVIVIVAEKIAEDIKNHQTVLFLIETVFHQHSQQVHLNSVDPTIMVLI